MDWPIIDFLFNIIAVSGLVVFLIIIMWNIERWNIEDEYFDLIEPKGDIVRISMRIGKRTTTSIGAVQKRYRLQG
jgi:hypothetical protein